MPTPQEELATAFNLYDQTVHAIAVAAHDAVLAPYMAANDLVFVGKSQAYHGIYTDTGETITWESVPQDVKDLFDILYWNDMENHFLSDLFPVSPMP